MKLNQKQMISELIKEGRLAKGFTQKELSEAANISIRSIQRIENGQIIPRSYTLKTLAEVLGLSYESFQQQDETGSPHSRFNRGQKIIISIGTSLLIIFLGFAFTAQSARFPETTFETILLGAFILFLITISLVIIWRTRS